MSKTPGPEKSTMARSSEVLEFIRRGTKPSIEMIAAHMGCDKSTARKYCTILRDLGRITRERIARVNGGSSYHIYSIGEDLAPGVTVDDYQRLPMAKKRNMHKRGYNLPDEQQRTVKAVQIGMPRDWAVAALFGEARK